MYGGIHQHQRCDFSAFIFFFRDQMSQSLENIVERSVASISPSVRSLLFFPPYPLFFYGDKGL